MYSNLKLAARILAPVALILVFRPVSACAQEAGFGVRAGASVDPDQFVVGGHIETEPIIPRLTFRPNLELGLGSSVTAVAVNMEFAYWFPLQKQPLDIYVGAGPALLIYSFDRAGRFEDGNTEVRGGFNFLAGIQHRKGLFGEVKLGVIDSPEFKITVGYSFR
ncbi:MAG: hypothetical protein HXY20_00820 [Acidobacteria bacterium]|nr:hypothetical protein [Acidobacteriota bacterium]